MADICSDVSTSEMTSHASESPAASEGGRASQPNATAAPSRKRAPLVARDPECKRARGSTGAPREETVVGPGGQEITALGTCNEGCDDAALDVLMAMNFYDALGTQPGATNAEIRRAFKAAALKHHPDKGGDPRAFQYLCRVRDILLNKAKREQYDFHGRAPFAEAFSKPPPSGGVEAADDVGNRLLGQRILFGPVSEMLEKMAGDEAWAKQSNAGATAKLDIASTFLPQLSSSVRRRQGLLLAPAPVRRRTCIGWGAGRWRLACKKAG